MTTSVIDQLLVEIGEDILGEIGEYNGHETILVPNETIRYNYGEVTEVPSAIELKEDRLQIFPTRTVWELDLTSVSMRLTNTQERTDRVDFNAVGVGRRDLQVHVADRWLSVGEFLVLLLKGANPKENRSSEAILASLRQRGLALSEAMPIFFQHLGADMNKFHGELVPFMLSQGAIDNTDQVNRNAQAGRQAHQGETASRGSARTQKSLRLEGSGLKLVSFAAGTSDRRQSASHNGYISPLDASFTTLMAIVKADRAIAMADAILANEATDEATKNLATAQRNAMFSYWTSGQQRNRRPFHNWGGTTQGFDAAIPGALRFFSTSVPMAEFSVQDRHGVVHDFNMWRRNSTATAGEEVLPRGFGDSGLGDEGTPLIVTAPEGDDGQPVVY